MSWILQGSTSTALHHLKQVHLNNLTQTEITGIYTKASGTEQSSPTSKLPARSPRSVLYNKIKLDSHRGLDLNSKLCVALLSSSVPFSAILDNSDWGVFVETLSHNQYNLPSRRYMNDTIVPMLYDALKGNIKNILENTQYIALTTDAWRSFAKQSYIGLTCHIINHNGELQNFLLSTTEITTRHTSLNLREHIKKILVDWGLHLDTVTTNFNQINEDDIEAHTDDIDDGVNFLENVRYYRDDIVRSQLQWLPAVHVCELCFFFTSLLVV